jgi:hypothetical protein
MVIEPVDRARAIIAHPAVPRRCTKLLRSGERDDGTRAAAFVASAAGVQG